MEDDSRIIIFRNRLRPGVEAAYAPRAEGVYALARNMPGFRASADFVAADGERIAIIEFDSAEHLANWRFHPEHQKAQGEGRSRWYSEYSLQICTPLRESRYVEGRDRVELPAAAKTLPPELDAEGGCACGAVRYRVRGASLATTLCHCHDCRRACGATPVAWAAFAQTDLSWSKGTPAARKSSPGAQREHCRDCGTQLTYRTEDPSWLDLTIASLDDPNLISPARHIWTGSKVDWVNLRDELPRHKHALPSPEDEASQNGAAVPSGA